MAATYSITGQTTFSGALRATASGEYTGGLQVLISTIVDFTASGGTEPDLTGFLSGSGSISGAIDMLLADPTDPMAGAGSAAYAPPGFAPSGAAKVKFIYIRNSTAAGGGNLKVERGAAAGLPIFDAAGEGLNIPPQGYIVQSLYDGATVGTVTTTTNDKLTVTPSAGTVTFDLVVAYGP